MTTTPLTTPYPGRPFDPREETLNAVTHALGLALALVGAVVVIAAALRGDDPWRLFACALYAATLVAAYAASTLSHLFRDPRRRDAMRKADQAVIFLFIVGSWTPMAVAWLRAWPWWILHGSMWAIAIVGFVAKAMFSHRTQLGTVSTAMYVLIGWLPMLAAWPLSRALPFGLLMWLVAGGACYSAGIVFFRYDARYRYFHAAWHLCVIAGSACHYFGILLHCTA